MILSKQKINAEASPPKFLIIEIKFNNRDNLKKMFQSVNI